MSVSIAHHHPQYHSSMKSPIWRLSFEKKRADRSGNFKQCSCFQLWLVFLRRVYIFFGFHNTIAFQITALLFKPIHVLSNISKNDLFGWRLILWKPRVCWLDGHTDNGYCHIFFISTLSKASSFNSPTNASEHRWWIESQF